MLRRDPFASPKLACAWCDRSRCSACDEGSSGSLTCTIGGDVNNLEHLVLQKRNGMYYLALWLEVPSWNGITKTDITAPFAVDYRERSPFGSERDAGQPQ
jgi:hypothetical protein